MGHLQSAKDVIKCSHTARICFHFLALSANNEQTTLFPSTQQIFTSKLINAKTLDFRSSVAQAGKAKLLWHERRPCSFEHRFFFLPQCVPAPVLPQSAL